VEIYQWVEHLFLHRLSEFLSTAWSHYISGQVFSSHLILSSSRTVRLCTPWGGWWIGQWRITWSSVFSSAPHSRAAEGAKTSDTGAEVVKRDSRCSCRSHSGRVGANVRDKSNEPCKCSATARHSIGDQPRAPHLCCCRQMNWWVVVRQVQMGAVAYEAGGGPRLGKFRAKSVFRASTSCSKILNVKTISNAVTIFRANSVFQDKRKLFKILKDKKYIQCSEFRIHSVFQGEQKLLKHPNCKKYIKYSKKFHDKFVLRASASSSKILKDKNISKQWKISGQTLFFRACASCSKFWIIKNIYIQYNEFRAHSVFQGKPQVA